MRRRILGATVVAGWLASAGAVTAETGAVILEPVTLDVRNTGAVALRCVVVLAHFVTRDTDVIPPHLNLTIRMERDAETGALAYGKHAGAPMWVENILCGAVEAWDRAHADLALTALRSGPEDSFEAGCAYSPPDRFACGAVREISEVE